MKRHLPLFLLYLWVGTSLSVAQLPEPMQDFRGLWVTGFKANVLGNTTAEDELIAYAIENDFNYLICTNMYQILTASCGSFTSDMTALQAFIAKAHYEGIAYISGNVGSLATAEKVEDYNNCGSVTSVQKLDMITYECEFYNDATNGSCPDYDSFIDQLNDIKAICTSTLSSTGSDLVCEVYIGGEGSTGKVLTYSSEAEMEEIASVADHILLTYYRSTPSSSGGNFFNWTIERLDWIAKTGTPSNIVLLLKSRDTDGNNMYDYLQAFPGTHYNAVRDPYLSWVEGTAHNPSLTKGFRENYEDATYPWLSGIQVKGFTWFEHLATMVDNNPLPVELVHFKASQVEDFISIQWMTTTERNNSFFEIQRSSDAQHWYLVNKVMGAGNTPQTQNYNWQDHNPLVGTSYYRLKQVDFDGKHSFSKMESVFWKNKGTNVQLYPNPANAIIHLQSTVAQGKVIVLNTLGQQMKQVSVLQNESQISLDISQIPAGMYTVRINGAGYRFVKYNGAYTWSDSNR